MEICLGLLGQFGDLPAGALGELAIYVQMMPFAIAHLGKPEIETLSSIAGGILLGYVVRHCRSIWPAVVLHLIMGLIMYNLIHP